LLLRWTPQWEFGLDSSLHNLENHSAAIRLDPKKVHSFDVSTERVVQTVAPAKARGKRGKISARKR
jgi:hypothetical protein